MRDDLDHATRTIAAMRAEMENAVAARLKEVRGQEQAAVIQAKVAMTGELNRWRPRLRASTSSATARSARRRSSPSACATSPSNSTSPTRSSLSYAKSWRRPRRGPPPAGGGSDRGAGRAAAYAGGARRPVACYR